MVTNSKSFFSCVVDQCRHSNSLLVNIRPPSQCHGLSLSDPSNPILHPPRQTYCTVNQPKGGSSIPQQAEMRKRVGYQFSLLKLDIWLLFFSWPLPEFRVVTENPWRYFLTLWTNTGQDRGHCIITTTSCVSWSLALRNVTSDYRLLW